MGEEAKDIPVLKSENFKEYLPESPAADYPNVVLQPLNTRQVFCGELALVL